MHSVYSRVLAAMFLLLPFAGIGQKKAEEEYKKQSAEVSKLVWAMDMPAFKNRNVPEKYNNYSKVIVARHRDYSGVAKSKYSPTPMSWLNVKRTLTYTRLTRELVKLNDAAAVNEYSEFSFTRNAQLNNYSKDKLTTFFGVRVIKKDGNMVNVPAEDAVLTNNTDKKKEVKIAIANLQVGDMIEYFAQTTEFYEHYESLPEIELLFASDAPILHYTVHMEMNKRFAIEYKKHNNPPTPVVSKDEEENVILDVVRKDIEASPTNFWMSAYRQMPILRIRLTINPAGSEFKPGQVYERTSSDLAIKSFSNHMSYLLYNAKLFISSAGFYIDEPYEKIKDKLGLGRRDHDAVAIYYAMKHFFLYQVKEDQPIVVDQRRNYSGINQEYFLCLLAAYLEKFDIPCKLMAVPSRFGPDDFDVFSKDDLELVVLADNKFFTIEGILTGYDAIPYRMEGETATLFDFKTRGSLNSGKVEQAGTKIIKTTKAEDNKRTEVLDVAFAADDFSKLDIKRKVNLKGHQKPGTQKELLLYEDVYEEHRKVMGMPDNLLTSLESQKRTRALAAEYKNAFAEARKKQKEYFEEEINDRFEIKEHDLKTYKVVQSGMWPKNPELVYTTDFRVADFAKKAGNNYIVEVGKLIGGQLQIKDEERKRSVDVYMPYPRSFENTIRLSIPEGYTVEGVDKLNMNVTNSTGKFTSKASLENNMLTLNVYKEYSNHFDRASEWSKVLEVVDAANTFFGHRLLLKKKG